VTVEIIMLHSNHCFFQAVISLLYKFKPAKQIWWQWRM